MPYEYWLIDWLIDWLINSFIHSFFPSKSVYLFTLIKYKLIIKYGNQMNWYNLKNWINHLKYNHIKFEQFFNFFWQTMCCTTEFYCLN